ncbi:MAG: LacI family DNA-binding transcriptional regulator [Acidobacteriaceae bacterium]
MAKAAGFSPSTVSIVLNGAPLSRYVAAATKQKIRETAERLNYHPDIFARSLRSRKSQTIGILVIDLADPFCTKILQGIERKLVETPYLPIIMDANNKPNQVQRYADMMIERRVEGLITVANWLFFDISVLEDISDGHLPTVVVGRDPESPTINSVAVDNEAGGYAAMEHLYSLDHREIAFVCGPRRLNDSRLRWRGIRSFAKKARLRLNPAFIRSLPDISDSLSSFEGSRNLTAEYLQSGEPFTAILAFDDISAYGALRALSEAGRRVPEDCSVIGFDDIPTAALVTPGLTTIRQPMLEMGEYAAERILKMLNESEGERDGFYGQSHMMAPELVRRGSTAKWTR